MLKHFSAHTQAKLLTMFIPVPKWRKTIRHRLKEYLSARKRRVLNMKGVKYKEKVLAEMQDLKNVDKLSADIKIVSLGYDCFVRTILTDWGLKPRKSEGELSYPFDLAVHPSESLLHIVENDFGGYFDGLTYDETNKVWINSSLRLLYNHDKDCKQNEQNKLVKRFEERIKNFRNILQFDGRIFFVAHVKNKNDCLNVYEAYKILRRQRKGKFSKLILLSFDEFVKNDFSSDVFVINRKCPYADYVWYEDQRYLPIAEKFERDVVENCLDIIKKNNRLSNLYKGLS